MLFFLSCQPYSRKDETDNWEDLFLFYLLPWLLTSLPAVPVTLHGWAFTEGRLYPGAKAEIVQGDMQHGIMTLISKHKIVFLTLLDILTQYLRHSGAKILLWLVWYNKGTLGVNKIPLLTLFPWAFISYWFCAEMDTDWDYRSWSVLQRWIRKNRNNKIWEKEAVSIESFFLYSGE